MSAGAATGKPGLGAVVRDSSATMNPAERRPVIGMYGSILQPHALGFAVFIAGMSLMDTTDGMFMNVAYGWAFFNPIRKVFYNLAITGLSVAICVFIGGIETLSWRERDGHRRAAARAPPRPAYGVSCFCASSGIHSSITIVASSISLPCW
jgi:High-affinity nickel-transport protein